MLALLLRQALRVSHARNAHYVVEAQFWGGLRPANTGTRSTHARFLSKWIKQFSIRVDRKSTDSRKRCHDVDRTENPTQFNPCSSKPCWHGVWKPGKCADCCRGFATRSYCRPGYLSIYFARYTALMPIESEAKCVLVWSIFCEIRFAKNAPVFCFNTFSRRKVTSALLEKSLSASCSFVSLLPLRSLACRVWRMPP